MKFTMAKSLILMIAGFAAMFQPLIGNAQTKHALIIGIDIYQPTSAIASTSRAGWTNLDGCVNDAKAIKEIIVGRFGFEDKNITTVYDQEANRARIIAELEALINKSAKGDVVFIYYAGHGSQVKNSLSVEEAGDFRDESIVPADLMDIRDKELAALFNRLLDKGVILTMIFDSCHSGSIARGNNLPETPKTRFIEGSSVDAKDPSDPLKPEERGALIISAAQPEQLAKEAKDDNGNPHGAFTVALMKALNSSSVNESAEVIFLRIKAIMQANGSTQEPVLGGNEKRRKQGLFGEDLSAISGKTVVAVQRNTGTENIDLQGGWALGLNAGCELKKIGGEERIVITDVTGMAKAVAKMVSGDNTNIKPGDLFEVVKWASPNKANLYVWFPSNTPGTDELNKTVKAVSALASNSDFTWLTDPTETAPQFVIQFYNNSWWLFGPEGKKDDLGKNPTAEQIAKKMTKGASVYFQIPPSKELVALLKIGKNSENNAIEITQDLLSADYILVGRYEGNGLQYAWIRPNITVADSAFQSTLPVRTDWIAAGNQNEITNAGNKLTDFALRLGKINAWLTLNAPPDDGTFPFSLALKNMTTGQYVSSGDVREGEKYSVVMVTDKNKLKKWNNKSRYIYVFIIDAAGKTQQIFPDPNLGNEGNKLPNKAYEFEEEISLGNITFTITPPFGSDSYFMISSEEAINNFQAFNNDGVVTRGVSHNATALDDLLGNVGATTRGITSAAPVTWSFQRLAITSKEK